MNKLAMISMTIVFPLALFQSGCGDLRKAALPGSLDEARKDARFRKSLLKLTANERELVEAFLLREKILGTRATTRPTIDAAIKDQLQFQAAADAVPRRAVAPANGMVGRDWILLRADGSVCPAQEASSLDCPIIYDVARKVEWQRLLTDEADGQAWNSTGLTEQGPKEANAVCDLLSASRVWGKGWRLPTETDFTKSTFFVSQVPTDVDWLPKYRKKLEGMFGSGGDEFMWSSTTFAIGDNKKSAMGYTFTGSLESFAADGKEKLLRVRCMRPG